LRLRLGLAVSGLVWALGGTALFAAVGAPGWAAVLGVIALIAAVDIMVVVHHMHQGAHYQPGRDVPPYWPPDSGPRGKLR
jgi:hypothetical protein